MMTALLFYGYCQGIYSSRRIAKACGERADFMAVTALNQPDFRTVSDFRKRHLEALESLFVQVLRLCQKAAPGPGCTGCLRGAFLHWLWESIRAAGAGGR